MTDYQTLSARAQWIATGALVGLLLMMVLTTMVMPTGGRAPNWQVGMLLSLPLLVVMPWLLRGSVTAHIWAGFLSLFYFGIAVTNLFLPRGGLSDWIELLLSITLFTATMLYARWRSRAQRSLQEV